MKEIRFLERQGARVQIIETISLGRNYFKASRWGRLVNRLMID